MTEKLVSCFQEKVYDAVKRIPRGRVTTYKLLAQYINCRSAQAVGQALSRNPFAPNVPCHRVISSNLQAGGFKGKRSGQEVNKKLKLLASEGIFFNNGKLADPNRIYRF